MQDRSRNFINSCCDLYLIYFIMDRFVAPQFIDVEDRIIGPITTRQFIMIVIGGVIAFSSYKLLDTGTFVFVSFFTAISIVIFGFIKINGKHFYPFVASVIEAVKRPKARVWCKKITESDLSALRHIGDKQEEIKSDFTLRKATMNQKRLSELALIVDTGGIYEG